MPRLPAQDPLEPMPPDRRRLRTFAFDPMSTRLSGQHLVVDVPFEALTPGPQGRLVRVVDYDESRGAWYRPVDLNCSANLAQDGMRPSEGDPRSHQQIVYAVSMSVIERFERFMGRRFNFRADKTLRLVPHAFEGRNAFFDPERRAVLFGYYRSSLKDPGANLPGQVIFTCLSNDIIGHEVTHAIVHRLRPYYSEATNLDVFALHEAFADLVALFQHFAYPDVVVEAIADSKADLRSSKGLLDLAREFGESTGRGRALRSALDERKTSDTPPSPDQFRNATEPHARGACFVMAIFDAYLEAYQAAIADLERIATGGTGVLPPGRLPPDLVNRVAREAVRTADRMLGMVVRAFDYLPVVDPTFGDVVRAIVTVDRDLYPEDELHLRARLVESLRRRGIYPPGVSSLADDALAWPMAPHALRLDDVLDPAQLRQVIMSATLKLDVLAHGAAHELNEHSTAVDQDVFTNLAKWAVSHHEQLGLVDGHPIRVDGLHVSYRQAADRQPRPEIVVQLSQRRTDLEDQRLPEGRRPVFRAGTTLIAHADGTIRYVIAKPLPVAPAAAAAAPAKGEPAPPPDPVQKFAADRFERLSAWISELDAEDALTAWTDEPAMLRLDFATLHASQDAGVEPEPEPGHHLGQDAGRDQRRPR